MTMTMAKDELDYERKTMTMTMLMLMMTLIDDAFFYSVESNHMKSRVTHNWPLTQTDSTAKVAFTMQARLKAV